MPPRPDPIVEEVRAAREAYSRRFGHDLRAICRDLREQERAGGRELVALPPRRPDPSQAGIKAEGAAMGEPESTAG